MEPCQYCVDGIVFVPEPGATGGGWDEPCTFCNGTGKSNDVDADPQNPQE